MVEQFVSFTQMEIWMLITLFALFFFLLFFILKIYGRPWRSLPKEKKEERCMGESTPPVSVIVYAKNESENLKKNLPFLLTQEYPDYEVIVINDGSTDESEEVLKIYENQYSNLYHTFVPQNSKYLSRKKLALTVGIKAAKNDVLLFTEANCFPQSPLWISKIAGKYQEKTAIVLGFCSYPYAKGFFHKLVSYDNLVSGLQYLSAAIKGHPYKGNGRNLSYRKQLFFENRGFSRSLNLHAGEDDLFINGVANANNTRTVFSPESLTAMEPISYFKVWKESKVSRAATQKYYKGWSLFAYRLECWAFYLFFLCACGAVILGITHNPLIAVIGIVLFGLWWLTKAIVFRKAASMLNQPVLSSWLPIFDLMLPVFHFYIRIYRGFRGKNDYTFHMPR